MTNRELIQAFRSLSVETKSLACLGCGYEHGCGIHGCAIMQAAADRLSALQSENGSKDREIERLKATAKQWRKTSEENFTSCEKLQAALSRAEAERDAAISDVPHDCEHCKHATGSESCKLLPDGDQFSPDYTEGFDRDGNCEHWEWRGAQGEG